jgi:hypothetical protein
MTNRMQKQALLRVTGSTYNIKIQYHRAAEILLTNGQMLIFISAKPAETLKS